MIKIIAAITYGILALVGGILGYLKVKSKPSLISGIVSGISLICSGVVSLLGQSWGLTLAIILTMLLIIVFMVRLIKTRKFMPAGFMTSLGVLCLIILLHSPG